jgi:hypothetical protein
MWNEKEQAQSSGTFQDDVVVARRAPIAQSYATSQHHATESNATTQDEYTQVQYWDDDEESRDHRSYLTRLVTIQVPLWVIFLQCFALAISVFHTVQCHSSPWNSPKPSLAIPSMQLTQTADKTCIEFKGVTTVCLGGTGSWKIDPASGQISITELH